VFFLAVSLSPAFSADQSTNSAAPELPAWDRSYEVRLWSGYKDNVLLANSSVQGSALVGGGLDFMLFRLPSDGADFFLFATGDYSRYLSAQDIDHEATAIVQSQLKKNFGNDWSVAGTAQYLYFDQVFDASSIYNEFAILPVQGHSLSFRPSLRRDLPNKFWAELQFGLERQIYQKNLDDFWEGGPELVLGRNYGQRSEITLSYELRRRLYDTRSPRDEAGNVIDGPSLITYEHEALLNWRHYWDEKRRWQTGARLGIEKSVNNGSEFYDYWRYQAGGQFRFRSDLWEARAEGRVYFYQYDTQPIAVGDAEKRRKTTLDLSFRVERKLIGDLKAFARYEYERSLSNIDFDQYKVNTITAGLDWEF